jgi:hypothetical protein
MLVPDVMNHFSNKGQISSLMIPCKNILGTALCENGNDYHCHEPKGG